MPANPAKKELDGGQDLTIRDVLNAHAAHGKLDYHMVKKAMGKNWPSDWDRIGPGDAIFAPDEERDRP